MERNQLFSLCWKDVASKQNQIFNDLWQKGEQLDVTVICGLKTFYAHRIVLSASSTYFRQTLKDVSTNGNAVLLLPTIDPEIFAGLLQFIYSGEVSVEESQLKTFLDTANTLKIGGIHSESHSNGLTEESLLKTTDNASISILNDTDREWESNEHSPFVDQSRASASPCNIKCEVVDDMVTESDEHTQMYDCESDSMTYQPGTEYPKSASGSFEDSLVRHLPVPVATSTKTRRVNLSIAEKVEIICMLEQHMPRIDIVKKFGCSNSLLTKISSDKDSILREWEVTGNPNRKRKKSLKFPDMETELRSWFCQARNTGLQVSDSLLEEKAKEIAARLNNREFVFSPAWLSRWKKRNYKNYWKEENSQRISALRSLTINLV